MVGPSTATPQDEPNEAERIRPLLRDRNFLIFWSAQTLSDSGSSFTLVALPLLVLHATGSVAQMGLLTGTASVGSILATLFAGILVDRLDRRIVMICCDAARCALLAGVVAWSAAGAGMWILYLVMALNAVCDTVFQTAVVAVVPTLVGRERAIDANSRLQTSSSVAFVLGPALAGLAVARFGSSTAIGIDAVSFGIEAAAFCCLRLRSPRQVRRAERGVWRRFRLEFEEGVRFLWRHPALRTVTILLTPITFLTFGLTDVFIYYVRHGLGLGDQAVGLMFGAAGIGTLVGASMVPLLRGRLGFGATWLGSYVLLGLVLAFAGLSPRVATVVAMAALASLATTVAGICSVTLRQQVTPEELLGRVTSAFWTIHVSAGPLGAIAVTAAVGRYGLRGPLLAIGAGLLVFAVAGMFSPVRHREPESLAPAAAMAATPAG